MFHNKTIFTSNYDFAKDVCGNCALYFDPLNPDDIFNIIKKNYDNPIKLKDLQKKGVKRLEKMNDWNKTFNQYQKVIKDE
jgi:glycosyltransferase involved in cell wall biosynthesis